MPEGIEVELYRQSAERTVGRTVAQFERPDPSYFRAEVPAEVAASAAEGCTVTAAWRHGKLLLLELGEAMTLGLRFGMTGRLIVDGQAIIDKLEYSSARDDPAWDRFSLLFTDGTRLAMRDPRRLGSVTVDPDVSRLGPDVFSLDGRRLRELLAGSQRPLKARLLDQSQLAGLGNLLTDEILWRASLDPRRRADTLDARERRRLLRHIHVTLDELTARGGSHLGDLQEQRHVGGVCPLDGVALARYAIGGRTTYACPHHQAGQGGALL